MKQYASIFTQLKYETIRKTPYFVKKNSLIRHEKILHACFFYNLSIVAIYLSKSRSYLNSQVKYANLIINPC